MMQNKSSQVRPKETQEFIILTRRMGYRGYHTGRSRHGEFNKTDNIVLTVI